MEWEDPDEGDGSEQKSEGDGGGSEVAPEEKAPEGDDAAE